MWMTANDIVGSIHRNGGDRKQLKVLADINACSIESIEAVLEKNGCVKVGDVWQLKKIIVDHAEAKKKVKNDDYAVVEQVGPLLPENHKVVIKRY